MAEAQKALRTNMSALRAEMAGDTLALAIAQEQARFDALRKQTEEALAGRKNEAERERVLRELSALEAERIRQLQAEAEVMRRNQREDLEVRALRAQGRDAEANAMAMQLAHAREYEAMYKDLNSDGLTEQEKMTLARLKEVQAMEATRKASDGLNASMLNLPPSFKSLNRIVFDAMDAIDAEAGSLGRTRDQERAAPRGTGGPPPFGRTPDAGGGGAGISGVAKALDRVAAALSEPTPIEIKLDREKIAQSTINVLKQRASRQKGINSNWTDAR